jgi:hypothetical protein
MIDFLLTVIERQAATLDLAKSIIREQAIQLAMDNGELEDMETYMEVLRAEALLH